MLVKCADCDLLFDPRPSGRGPSRERCDTHVRLRKRELARARDMVNRAKEWGVETELVIAREVFERDAWICHLCGELIPETLRSPRILGGTYEPLAPVVDHVIPLSKGGPHTLQNCRAAHWTCNARKFNIESGVIPPPQEESAKPSNRISRPTGRRCTLDGCERAAASKGLCGAHARRLKRYGDANKVKCGCGCGELVAVAPSVAVAVVYLDGHGVMGGITDLPEVKLKKGLVPQPVSERGRRFHGLTDECQVWSGSKNKMGYGRMYIQVAGQKRRGRVIQVHRLAYELANGEGSAHNLTIDHLCGIPSCCNPNHLEAVTIAENVRRASIVIGACPKGHPYDDENTLYSLNGHRRCRQCSTDVYHIATHGHEFVNDPENRSERRRRCLVCRRREETTPQFCPQGHEYTPENKRIDSKGKRVCQQCLWDRRHIPDFGHPFVPDPDYGSEKRSRCVTCHDAKPERTHCINGHEYTDLTTEYTAKGQRNCVQCRLNAAHLPRHGHEYIIDADNPTKMRRCLVCLEAKQATPQKCPRGHEFTPENTRMNRGWRNCRTCERNRQHRKLFGHDFVADPNGGKRARCGTCLHGALWQRGTSEV
ncbi:hypothetical protein ACN93_19585 [Gordonia paraffinivorans]|uniref:HNH endonuclease n=1 Tax=Gordonia paraffinivorans TaxID=175628 RepID=UPI000D616A8E|nr:HNH endonuclease [Gordonia paraffinivorans]PWD41354.1 hypothetical protein ACN93_19585 [Gordonia paraffinivorans]